MNDWWQTVEWPCACQGADAIGHVHYAIRPHACARCVCWEYRPHIPEQVAIRILLGPEMRETEAAAVLLGPP